MEKFIDIFILVHVILGSIALSAGIFAIIFKKGSKNHKLAGIIFYYFLLVSSIMAIIITFLPGHKNIFLLCIGVFSTYLVYTGYRSLKYRKSKPSLFDKFFAVILMAFGLGLLFIGVRSLINENSMGIVAIVFGGLASWLSIGDLRSFKDLKKLKKMYLRLHVSKIMGAFIASTTALIVNNQILPGAWGWLAPTVIGTFYITYWSRKLRGK